MAIEVEQHSDQVGADLHVPGYVQSGDPGAVGAGKLWFNTTTDILKVRNAADSGWVTIGSGGVDLSAIDFLVGTASGLLSGEIAVGTTPGGELSGTWASPTVDGTHSGSSHAGVVTAHEALGDPHPLYRLEADNHSHASSGAQGGTIAHSATTGQTVNDHHNRDHASTHLHSGADMLAIPHTINFTIDGGGLVITTGIKGDIKVDFDCLVTEWSILGDQTGSIVVDIWKDTYGNYPPVVGDSMTTSEKPTLSSASKNQDTSLNGGAGWAIAAGSILRWNVDSVTTITRVTIALKVQRT